MKHNSNADIGKKAADYELLCSCGCSTELCGWEAKTAVTGELQFDKFTTPSSFLCWKIRFRNQLAIDSDSHLGSDVMDRRGGDGRPNG